jgi:integrase
VCETWFAAHVCEAATRQSYAFWLDRYVLPAFGHLRLDRVDPATVRDVLAKLRKSGASQDVQEAVRCVLGAIFTTAVADRIVPFHPCQGVKLPPDARRPLQILTPTEYDLVRSLIHDPVARLLVDTAVESGCRWGELAELRVKDLDPHAGILTVSRAVVELRPRFHPAGGRYLVKPYPKNGRSRRFRLRHALLADLTAHISAKHLGPGDLLFATAAYYGDHQPVGARPGQTPDLGWTAPGPRGYQYRHDTQAGYGPGGCRCQPCHDAIAAYRATRRAHGKDRPPVGRHTCDGHLSRNWFRTHRWQPALRAAGIERKTTFHDLRHAHASWLLEGGASLEVVRERLGHASIVSTARYLHTLPNADDTALTALDRIHPARRATRIIRALTRSETGTRKPAHPVYARALSGSNGTGPQITFSSSSSFICLRKCMSSSSAAGPMSPAARVSVRSVRRTQKRRVSRLTPSSVAMSAIVRCGLESTCAIASRWNSSE